jgi:hypothetical protein
MSISGFFWQAMIHSPASIPIGNETDVTRDIIFRHCCPGDDFFIPGRRLMARQLSHI